MISIEGIRLKIFSKKRKMFSNNRRKKLVNTQFTIISNNCWGGETYENYGLQKQSPTVGLFFMPKDYIKFCKKLDSFLNAELQFIAPGESKWKDKRCINGDSRFGHYPIGKLTTDEECVELFFLHYTSEQQALEKWNRRIKRVDKTHLLFKFNDQNGCDEQDLNDFLNLPYKNKLFFTCKKWNSIDLSQISKTEFIQIHQPGNQDFIRASFEPFDRNKYLNISSVINNL